MRNTRPQGVCNCPFREGFGKTTCKLDGKSCKVISDEKGLWCRGWLPSGKASSLQKQGDLFSKL